MAGFTVLGASGFIGSALVAHLRALGTAVEAPARGAALTGRPLGHVVYFVGLTADFRTRPFETVEAHVGLLSRVLQDCAFDTLTYLSSTRVYVHSTSASETAALTIKPSECDDIFALSKLLGESLCLNSGRPCRIVRPSNVFGAGEAATNFLPSVLAEAARTGRVRIKLSPASAKDYVGLDDVVRWIAAIAVSGTQQVYNLASGRNVSNAQIAEALGRLGLAVDFDPGGPTVSFPPIDVARVTAEFGPPRADVIAQIPALFDDFKRRT